MEQKLCSIHQPLLQDYQNLFGEYKPETLQLPTITFQLESTELVQKFILMNLLVETKNELTMILDIFMEAVILQHQMALEHLD